MKRTICKHCKPNRETIIGVETHCSECGKELIHILNKNNENIREIRAKGGRLCES
jgi:bacterioferritin-associated ferredoxin